MLSTKQNLLQAWNSWRAPVRVGEGRAARVAETMLGIGVFWSIGGVFLTPTMKLYHTLLVLFVYLPALWLVISRPASLKQLLHERIEARLFLVLLVWAGLSLFWNGEPGEHLSRLKRLLLFCLLVCGWVLWARMSEQRLRGTMMVLGALNSLYSVAALLWLKPVFGRMSGFGGFLDNPNAAAYATGFVMLLALPLLPAMRSWRIGWLLLQIPPLIYVGLCASRGTLLGLMVVALFYLVFLAGRRGRWIALLVLAAGAMLAWLEPTLLARGDSGRFELLQSAWPILKEHFWIGLGYGAGYELHLWGRPTDMDVHNFLMHTAMQYGVPALLVWCWLWVALGLQAWRARHTQLGLSVLLLWVFASVAMQFDVFSLWERTRAMWLMPWVVVLLGLSLKVPTNSSAAEQN